jgi:hypothetical protein
MAFDNIVGTTLRKYFAPGGKAVDNIFKRTATLNWLQTKAKLQSQGGTEARHPVEGATNTTFQTYSGYDQLTPANDELIDTAVYQWKQAAIFVPMSGIEEAKNSGDSAVINLLQTKINNAEMTAAEEFETMLFNSDGSGNGGKDWGGLPALIGTTNSAGGISGALNTWWQSYVDDAGGSDTALNLKDMAKAYNSVSYGVDKCDYMVTTQELYEAYEQLLLPQQRFTDPTTGKAGFDNLVHKAGTVVWSDFVPEKKMYFLNSNHLKLTVLSNKWMDFRGFIEPYDVDAKYALILSYGTFATDGRRYLGVLENRVAPTPA